MTKASLRALDLFAGTGWGVACQRLGIDEMGVEIMPEAVATREANGMHTIYRDVWDGLTGPILSYDILIASPPCQTFSLAGKGAGRAALNDVIEAIRLHAYKDPAALKAFGEKHDPRTALVLTPLAHVWRDRPRFVAMEQVPTVLPVWEACAEVMRGLGYSVKVANLQAEQYGVPQTRKRAILVARLDDHVQLPTPTHSRYYSRTPDKLDPGVKKWVSMAEALGWTKPGVTFTQNNKQAHQAHRAMDQPAPTVTAGHDFGNRGFIDGEDFAVATPDEVAALQSYPVGRGLADRPAPTITGGGTESGGAEPIAKYHERYTSSPGWVGGKGRLTTDEAAALQSYPATFRNGNQANAAHRATDQPAPTIAFGHNSGRVEWVDGDLATKVSIEEAGALQTYEKPFVWCGAKTKQFLQIGNAVPPLLAEAILSALTAPQLDIEELLAEELVTA